MFYDEYQFSTRNARSRMLSFTEYNEALGLGEVEAWEKQYLLNRGAATPE